MTLLVTDNQIAGDLDNDTALLELARTSEPGFRRQHRDMTASGSNNALLPAPVANLVSFATRSTGLAVRITSAIGGYGLDVAKITTLSTLQLGRCVVEGVLSSAAKDTIVRSASSLAGADAEADIERTIERLHTGVDQLVFWAATGFNFTSAALSTVSETSQLLLSTLDQFFGSTDSSRAMASIITMVRREFANPPAGGQGETVSVGELAMALCALAYLQRSCSALLEEESRAFEVEEIVWDVVVLNDGVRVDVQEENLRHQLTTHAVAPIQQDGSERHDGLPTQQLEQEILKSLPANAKVSITREIVTSETIRVNIIGDVQQIQLEPPPGIELVEENRDTCQAQEEGGTMACAQFVFRHERRQERRMSLQKSERDASPVAGYIEALGRQPGENLSLAVDTTAMPGPGQAINAISPSPLSNSSSIPSQRMPSNRPLPSTSSRGRNHQPVLQGKSGGFRDVLKKSMSVFSNQKTKSQELFVTPKHGTSTSYVSVHESLHQSTMSLTETYSIAATDDDWCGSVFDEATESPRVETVGMELGHLHDAPARNHRRKKSYTASIYTLAAAKSETSLVSYHAYHRETLFNSAEKLSALRQAGVLHGMFPERHFLANAARYMRFASASYGSNFLKVMGIATEMPRPGVSDDTHRELRAFAHHTRSTPSSILLSSFVDPQGGSDGTGETNTGVPLVHYISLDHESKAVVLACRGTLGFEDVLTDMACDYDSLVWRGNSYKVHKGVHASARRLLYGGDGRVLCTLKAALEEFPGYGLILTGHSLGAAVTSLLGIMLSEPGHGTGTPFVTSSEPHHDPTGPLHKHICLPPNRAIHVYAYGPPATVSPTLRAATRGLVTTVIHGADLVPFLSLGVLHDIQGAALALKRTADQSTDTTTTTTTTTKTSLAQRIFHSTVTKNLSLDPRRWTRPFPAVHHAEGDDAEWAHAQLRALRSNMAGDKLVPPGEVFVVESTPVLRRDAFVAPSPASSWEDHFGGRPARRMVVKYVGDVERRFGEVRFGRGMLADHSPGRYEAALERLVVGVGVRG